MQLGLEIRLFAFCAVSKLHLLPVDLNCGHVFLFNVQLIVKPIMDPVRRNFGATFIKTTFSSVSFSLIFQLS
jgi:hypothetical protein